MVSPGEGEEFALHRDVRQSWSSSSISTTDMRISETTDRLVVQDVPMAIWLLGLAFVTSGSFVLTIPLWSADWPRIGLLARSAIVVIGASHLAGGSYTMLRAAATRTELDRQGGVGRQIVRRPWRRGATRTQFALADARALEIVRSTDSDGDPIFQLRLWLAGSRPLWLMAQPVHGEQRLLERADRVRTFLGLPPVTGLTRRGAT